MQYGERERPGDFKLHKLGGTRSLTLLVLHQLTGVGEPMTETAISFSTIPKISQLYKDYLYNFERVSRFYESEGRDLASLVARAARVAAQPFARDAVADVLAEQNKQAGAGAATFANIERLRQRDAVVVITGQQAGLFAGPLYTVFKALTAIKLAERLRAEGVNAVPMFWIAAEDHDFEEVNHTRVVNREGHLTTITYTACSPKEGKPVGHVTLAAGISENIEQLLDALPESEFTPQIADDLRAAYQAGDSFAAAYLAARLDGADPVAAARAGHRLAGVVVCYPGAIIPRGAMPPAGKAAR